jgi:hypothetical protein
MKTDVDTCLKEIADWYVKNRRKITPPKLLPILQKHCESEEEIEKFVSFLETEPGQLRFKTLLRETIKRCARCHTTKEVKYRPSTGLWLCDNCFKLWEEKPHSNPGGLPDEEGWVYAKVGTTEVRGRRDPTGIAIEQVSPTYDKSDFDKAVKIIEEALKKITSKEKMPRINPHATAIEQDKQLRNQMKWLKDHGFKTPGEAQEAGY